ncbi:ComEA family DNA-binding protein [Myceligenerans xiligouense]|uniref:Competence protein ComEA n=1 Tax=Myceligenerans xiligouense TaxID=253184 RepID=A0A3N4YMA9_9MICO|nr:ComEA family DNA-binding protein [Myceligenerans xiligouense]RPF20576.1 competence protein ComEA [Myceligenerans xiligouense]
MRADTDVMPAVPAVPEDTDDLVDRLRQRRSAGRVATAYAAAHGHPVGTDGDGTGRRWALGGRPGLVAVVAVLLLAGLTGAVALGRDALAAGDVRPIASAGDTGADDGVAGEAKAGGGPGGEAGTGNGRGTGTGSGTGAEAGPDGGAAWSGGSDAGAFAGSDPQGAPGSGVVAHVVGAVREPGLVELPGGARIADAVEAAGGPTGDADLSGVNLARPVTDGEQIHVPRPGETPAATGGAPGGTPAGPPETGGEGVDLNTADAATLETLPGIGPTLAQRIIEWRTANGPFASVDELDDVSGIGPAVLEQIRPVARV